ncbi:hypothetical protein LguiA_002688 [Lonicera macranthoides]
MEFATTPDTMILRARFRKNQSCISLWISSGRNGTKSSILDKLLMFGGYVTMTSLEGS